MPIVVGVRFKDSGKIYHFDPSEVPLMVGDWAIVDTSRGPELGRIAAASAELPQEQVIGEIKPVLRRASSNDLASLAHYEQYLDEALAICTEKVKAQNLPMRMVKAEYSFDGSRLTFFFTADKRVDFRVLVRELARTFHTRIELRQIGPRDEAKLLGGIGPCGRALCCSTFLPDYAKVSIKMAKDQDLPLNPVKVSGVCGRLLCCLSYEEEQYLQIRSELPVVGAWVQTPEGPGEVVTVNVVRETVTVQLAAGTAGDFTASQISTTTDQVATEARSRNAAGITPANQLQAELAAGLDPDALAVLTRLEDTPPAEVHPRPAPRALRPEATIMPTTNRSRPLRPPVGAEHPPLRSAPVAPAEPAHSAPSQPQTGAAASDRATRRPPRPVSAQLHPRPKAGSSDQTPAQTGRPGPSRKAGPRLPSKSTSGGPEARATPPTGPGGQPVDKSEATRRHRKRNRGDLPKE